MLFRSHKLAPHLEALISRAHYIDLSMKTKRDYIVRIRQVVSTGLLKRSGLDEDGERDVIEFVESNQDNLRELSLRMVLKVATCRRKGGNWKRTARVTCCR